ncbi:MAG: 2-hydroxy-3-oxopropionate reductase [Solirubrobacterales bacterium]|nr:2-hydroxy-3-oxopropionate reductase [Solirubrobacterales bacterium]MBV9715243.1 2-hydroxy-3-oxopropionate reductase [Solirubrobacterales bacterium]
MANKIGFIGLGIMGGPMANNLLGAGHELVVNTLRRSRAEEQESRGAQWADSPGEVAEQADTIITMLPDSPQVSQVVGGEQGILSTAREGTLVIDMSTIAPGVTTELARAAAEKGVGMVDAPVSGGDIGAKEGTLSIMAGGSEQDFARAKPLLEVLGKTIVHVGAVGAGQVVKACNQIVVALSIEAVAEALVLGSKAGVEPARILDVLSGGLAGNRVMQVRRENFLSHDFKPGFRIDLHHKDLGIALAAGREYGVPLPVTAIVDQMLQALRMRGHGSEDHSALLRVIEDSAQHEIGS